MNSIVWSHWAISGLYEQDSYRKKNRNNYRTKSKSLSHGSDEEKKT